MDDYENNTILNQELFKGYPTTLLHLAAGCCILFMLVGIPGNLITIIALFRYKKVRNATAVFIMNLSFSDLLFCCFNLPLAATLFWQRSWPHGDLLCQLFPLARYGLLAVSLFSVLAITINRYIMIGHPRLYPKIYKSHYLICMVILTWILGFGALIPTWLGRWGRFGLDTEIGSCSILMDERGNSPKPFLFTIAFIIPCLSILICYFRIFYIVRKTALKSRCEPGNNKVPMRKQLTIAQKSDTGNNMQLDNKKQCLSIEDSAVGTLSTAATLTDKNSSENEKYQYKNEGTSYLDNSSLNNDSYIIECSPTKSMKQLNVNQSNSQKNHESFVNNNGCEINILKKNSNNKVSKPNLLSPPTNKCNKIKINLEDESTSTAVSCDNEYLDNVSSLNSSFIKDINISNNSKSLKTDSHIKQLKDADNSSDQTCCSQIFKPVTNMFQHKNNYKCNQTDQEPSNKNKKQYVTGKVTSKDKRILKMIVVIFLSFFICYLPITIAKTSTLKDSKYFNIAGYILIYLTPCINPLIYVVMSSEYRQAYKNLLTCKAATYDGSGRST